MPMDMERDRKGSAALRGRAKGAAPRFGGTIPSPQQMTPDEARMRSLMERLAMEQEMPPMVPTEPRMSDIPNMSTEEIMQYNRPQMDINDAVFGDSDPAAFIRRLLGGR
jgi:hypothetical protein